MVQLLNVSAANPQVYDAALCAQKYLPPILKQYGQYMDPKTQTSLATELKKYA